MEADELSEDSSGSSSTNVVVAGALAVKGKSSSLGFVTSSKAKVSKERLVNLLTPIQPPKADHSFHGVIFSLRASSAEIIRIHGFGVAGELGPVKVFVQTTPNISSAEHGLTIYLKTWSKIFDKQVEGTRRSNDAELAILELEKPVEIQPTVSLFFYIHVNVFHDEGLIYQSFSKEKVIIDDGRLEIKAGLGRVGSDPFNGGQWRIGRGLSGSVLYEAIPKMWTVETHSDFSHSFRRSIVILLMLWNRVGTEFNKLPLEVMFQIFECFEHNWFDEVAPPKPPKKIKSNRKGFFKSLFGKKKTEKED